MQEKDRYGEASLIFWTRGQTADILYVAISCAHVVMVFVLDCSPGKQTETRTFAVAILREEKGEHIVFFCCCILAVQKTYI